MKKIVNALFSCMFFLNTKFNFFVKFHGKIIRICLSFSLMQQILNELYNMLYYRNKSLFHEYYGKIFRYISVNNCQKEWRISFMCNRISVPLQKEYLWLHWDSALSYLGHDIEIKETYEYLLKAKCVNCFVDIGANYGTHSLLFLSQGIQVYTIEPNLKCYHYFESVSKANNYNYNLIKLAVGEKVEKKKIYFPETETWLGFVQNSNSNTFIDSNGLQVQEVSIIPLDFLFSEKQIFPDLIKIDTEGYELIVLNSAINTIKKHKPKIIFEDNYESRDNSIYNFFNERNYKIFGLPFHSKNKCLNIDDFLNQKHNNFIAISQDL